MTTPILSVDLDQLGRNITTLRGQVHGAEIAPVVKANAYQLGAVPIANSLATHHGVRTLFVATPAEAVELALHLSNCPTLYVLNGYTAPDHSAFARHGARPVLNSLAQIADWTAAGGGPCALGIDLGMHRLGLSLEEVQSAAVQEISATVELCLMHLSHAGDPDAAENAVQTALYAQYKELLRPAFPAAKFSLSASGGIALPVATQEDMVRPGIALYGGASNCHPAQTLPSAITLTAPVQTVHQIEAGQKIGYNGTWTADRPTILATLAVGYADGYPRALSNRADVYIGGALCPVVGTISMDLTMVDITDAPAPIAPGDRAELFGDRINMDELAGLADTIAHDLLCRLSERVRREYIGA